MLKKIILTGLFVLGLFLVAAPQARAAIIENAYLSVSEPRQSQTSTHSFFFDIVTADPGSFYFTYCALPSGTCTGVGDGSTGSLNVGGILDGVGAPSQTFSGSWNSGSERYEVTSTGAVETSSAGTTWKIPFTTVTNPSIAQCTHNPPGNSSTGTCYVRISVFPQTNFGGTADTGIVSLTVTQAVSVTARVDPTFTFTVTGVNGGETRNSTPLTAAVTTTVTTIPFGNLTADTEKFAAHLLTVTTNTVGGYAVDARLLANLTGQAYGDDIDGFIGNSANQTTPQTWTAPTGTVSGTHSGWFGVGTDDTGVPNQAANSFYTLNSTDFTVASSNTSASTRNTYVVYGIEVNAFQEADNYTGTLLYTATPVY